MMIAIVIKNCICTLAWIALAVHFDRWWIALFGLLCVTTTETKRMYYRVCDVCGKHGPAADEQNKAIKLALDAGWVRWNNGDKVVDYCPDCKKS